MLARRVGFFGAAGIFAPMEDVTFVSEMIQSALMKFRFPQLYSLLTLQKLRRELYVVLDILIAGLKHGVEFTKTPER